MVEQPFAQDFRSTGDRNGVTLLESGWVTEGDGVRQDKIAICQKLIINSIKLVQYVNNQMR